MNSLILDQLSKSLTHAYISTDRLIEKSYLFFKIGLDHLGWLSPQTWAQLRRYPHICPKVSPNTVQLLPHHKDFGIRNQMFSKMVQVLHEQQHIAKLSKKYLPIKNHFQDTLLHIDYSTVRFFGFPQPLMAVTPFFRKEGQLYFYLRQQSGRQMIFAQEMLSIGRDKHALLRDICTQKAIHQGVASFSNSIHTRRLHPHGLDWRIYDNYGIEVAPHTPLKHAQAYALSEIANFFLTPQKLEYHTSILLSDILQTYKVLQILGDGTRYLLKA